MKFVLASIILVSVAACTSVTATRPDMELAQAIAAVKAAKEVQADQLSPGMYRKSTELLEEAKRDYRLKNYEEAKYNLKRSRLSAEQAELAALKSGGSRQDSPMPQSSPSPTH